MVPWYTILVAFAFLTVMGGLLWAPLELEIGLDRAAPDDQPTWNVGIVALFGLWRAHWNGPDHSAQPKQIEAEPKRNGPKPLSATGIFDRFSAFLSSEVIGRLLDFVRRLVAGVRIRHCVVRIQFGCEDPALTGLFWSYLVPLLWSVREREAIDIEVVPDFREEVFWGKLELMARTRPYVALSEVARLLAAPPIWKAVWTTLRNRL